MTRRKKAAVAVAAVLMGGVLLGGCGGTVRGRSGWPAERQRVMRSSMPRSTAIMDGTWVWGGPATGFGS